MTSIEPTASLNLEAIMKPLRNHRPGKPATDDPPERLLELADLVKVPVVVRTGLTTTADGRWALFVTVPRRVRVPIAEVEAQAGGFPVVYEEEPLEPPLAKPAPKSRV